MVPALVSHYSSVCLSASLTYVTDRPGNSTFITDVKINLCNACHVCVWVCLVVGSVGSNGRVGSVGTDAPVGSGGVEAFPPGATHVGSREQRGQPMLK